MKFRSVTLGILLTSFSKWHLHSNILPNTTRIMPYLSLQSSLQICLTLEGISYLAIFFFALLLSNSSRSKRFLHDNILLNYNI